MRCVDLFAGAGGWSTGAVQAGARTESLPRCPFGAPGDRLWVRETWTSGYARGCWGTIFAADRAFVQGAKEHQKGPHFAADDIPPYARWRPSIHMPRWASRLTLEIEAVRVERLNGITPTDAIAEGVERAGSLWKGYQPERGTQHRSYMNPAKSFESLWESVYGADSWAANPWVWAVGFRRVEP